MFCKVPRTVVATRLSNGSRKRPDAFVKLAFKRFRCGASNHWFHMADFSRKLLLDAIDMQSITSFKWLALFCFWHLQECHANIAVTFLNTKAAIPDRSFVGQQLAWAMPILALVSGISSWNRRKLKSHHRRKGMMNCREVPCADNLQTTAGMPAKPWPAVGCVQKAKQCLNRNLQMKLQS